MRRPVSWIGFLALASLAACSKPQAPDDPIRRFPQPIEVYDDSAQVASSPRPSAPTAVIPAALSEFECGSGARSNLPVIETSTREGDDGETLSVENYDPTGVTVFGFPADGLERFSGTSGWRGVATYVTAPQLAIMQAISARFPTAASSDGSTVTAPGMAGRIILQPATEGTVRIECAPARRI